MPARIPSSPSAADTTAAPTTAHDIDQPALNRAARRARRKGGTEPLGATPGVPREHRGAVSTKPAHHRVDFAARRSG